MEEDMDQELEKYRMEIEEDTKNLNAVVPYVELLNEKSKAATTSSELKRYLSKAKELELKVQQDDEVWGFIDEMQQRYRKLLKKENLKKIMDELEGNIEKDPESSSLFEEYLLVVKEYVPFCDYEECKRILSELVEHCDDAMDYDEVDNLMDALKDQTVRQDPVHVHSETRQIIQYRKEQYESNPTMENAASYAHCLYVNQNNPDRTEKIRQIYGQNPYNLSVVKIYTSSHESGRSSLLIMIFQ